MKNKFLIINLLSLFLPAGLSAQYAEVGLSGGGSHFLGDVGAYGPHTPEGFYGGLFFRYNIDQHWAVRLGANYGNIAADDADAGLAYRQNRNLSFQSEIWEGYLLMEFNYLEYQPGTPNWHTPYLLGGWGLFTFNPKTSYQGSLYELQPLGTEGQGTSANSQSPYDLASSFFVFGMGYKFALSRNWSIALESTFRSTQTDYLDDVSGFYADPQVLREQQGELAAALADRSLQEGDKEATFRGNPANKDWYIFTGITLQVKFEAMSEKCATFVR